VATTQIPVTAAWVAVLADAQDVNLFNRSSQDVEYIVDTSAPAVGDLGDILRPGETKPVVSASGEDVYVRFVRQDQPAMTATIVATDA